MTKARKKPLAERAKWASDGRYGPWWYANKAGGGVIEMLYAGESWYEVSCKAFGIYSEDIDAPTLAAAKARAIELVQERIRELAKAWEV